MARGGAQPVVGVALTPRDQEDRAEERGEQEDARECGESVGRVEAAQRNRDDEREPEDDVEHHRRPASLRREPEGVGLLGYTQFIEDAVRQGAGGRGTSGYHVADGETGEID